MRIVTRFITRCFQPNVMNNLFFYCNIYSQHCYSGKVRYSLLLQRNQPLFMFIHSFTTSYFHHSTHWIIRILHYVNINHYFVILKQNRKFPGTPTHIFISIYVYWFENIVRFSLFRNYWIICVGYMIVVIY